MSNINYEFNNLYDNVLLLFVKPGFDLWVGKIPWRREWLPTPVFLLGELHGQRNLMGFSPWSHKESDMTEQLLLSLLLSLKNSEHKYFSLTSLNAYKY